MSVIDRIIDREMNEMERISRKICDGNCATLEDYKARCAELKAHERAIRTIRETYSEYVNETETDNLEGRESE